MARPSKRSIAMKKAWATRKVQQKYNELNSPLEGKIIKLLKNNKSHSSPADLVARMKELPSKEYKEINFDNMLDPSKQTRLDILFSDLELTLKEVIAKLKAMF